MKEQPGISDDFLTMLARLCYIDGVPQQRAAAMLNISQAKVSRLLTTARERGIVRISVNEYNPRSGEQEKQLKDRYGLKEAIVVWVRREERIPPSGKRMIPETPAIPRGRNTILPVKHLHQIITVAETRAERNLPDRMVRFQ